MNKFVIEIFQEGELLMDEQVESDRRLLNELDLDCICVNKDKDMVFVRRNADTGNGYFIGDDGCWDYGTCEQALNVIKRRV